VDIHTVSFFRRLWFNVIPQTSNYHLFLSSFLAALAVWLSWLHSVWLLLADKLALTFWAAIFHWDKVCCKSMLPGVNFCT